MIAKFDFLLRHKTQIYSLVVFSRILYSLEHCLGVDSATTGAKAMKIQAGGEIIVGATAIEIVTKMRELYNQQFHKPISLNEEYMKLIIQRAKKLHKDIIYNGTSEEEKCSSFIESAIKAHLAMNISD